MTIGTGSLVCTSDCSGTKPAGEKEGGKEVRPGRIITVLMYLREQVSSLTTWEVHLTGQDIHLTAGRKMINRDPNTYDCHSVLIFHYNQALITIRSNSECCSQWSESFWALIKRFQITASTTHMSCRIASSWHKEFTSVTNWRWTFHF